MTLLELDSTTGAATAAAFAELERRVALHEAGTREQLTALVAVEIERRLTDAIVDGIARGEAARVASEIGVQAARDGVEDAVVRAADQAGMAARRALREEMDTARQGVERAVGVAQAAADDVLGALAKRNVEWVDALTLRLRALTEEYEALLVKQAAQLHARIDLVNRTATETAQALAELQEEVRDGARSRAARVEAIDQTAREALAVSREARVDAAAERVRVQLETDDQLLTLSERIGGAIGALEEKLTERLAALEAALETSALETRIAWQLGALVNVQDVTERAMAAARELAVTELAKPGKGYMAHSGAEHSPELYLASRHGTVDGPMVVWRCRHCNYRETRPATES